MKQKNIRKNIIISFFLILLSSTISACAMDTKSSELSKKFHENLSEDSGRALFKELYPADSDAKQMVNDLKEIGFKCSFNKEKDAFYCSKSRFFAFSWDLAIKVSQKNKITKINIQKNSALP